VPKNYKAKLQFEESWAKHFHTKKLNKMLVKLTLAILSGETKQNGSDTLFNR